jgi:multidrug efflux system membrane fusion protein
MPQPVHVATATQGEMPVVINSLGTVTPLASVTVKTQLNGTLQTSPSRKARWSRRGTCWLRSTLALRDLVA